MPVNNVTTNNISLEDAYKKTEAGMQAASLESDTFMSLLLAQMKNQNPFEPMKDNEMMAQMAQMNSVQELQKIGESLKEMNQTNQLLSATSMMGKNVTFSDEAGTLYEAIIKAITQVDGEVLLTAGESTVSLADILAVSEEG